MSKSAQTSDAYEELVDHIERYVYVGDAVGVLHWDQEVMMPDAGTPARSKQRSALSRLTHEILTDEQVTEWLAAIDEGDLDQEEAANVREIRRKHERAVSVPDDLVEEISEATSNALPVWKEAREAGDFSQFEDTLAELVDLKRQYAEAIDPDRDPYEVLFEEYEPYLGIDKAEDILADLRDGLVPLIDAIDDSDATLSDPFDGEYDEDAQEELCRAALDSVGYDWDRGRIDTAPHPFSSGTPFDARVTTKFAPDDPLFAFTSTVHEFGHASYTQGLPQDKYGTLVGQSRDLVVHESQSRLWENHVGRSLPFWEHFAPLVADKLGVDAAPEDYYEAANTIDPTNLIRIEADELTYHMHIVLRFEIERDLIRGDLDVSDVPQVWNEKMAEYLGVTPDDDGNGCLQDIHWTHGSFGYFPTYSLGSVLAAQLDATARGDLPLDEQAREGEFGPLLEWMRENVHQQGCRYTTPDLIQEATGQELSADPFLDYAHEKYGDLYDVSV
ncbi:carboxypeptidase M32 [Halobacteriales archaeon Cl-PHB]